jgi:cytochrome c oxidase assembly factor CtaG
MNFLYQIERLPLMLAILIHGGVLYLSYLGTYLLNGWLDRGLMPILIFTGLFLLGYLVIWVVIYSIIKRKTDKINRLLQEKQQSA